MRPVTAGDALPSRVGAKRRKGLGGRFRAFLLPLTAEEPKKRRARPDQETEVVPVPASVQIVDGELVPAAEGVHDQHSPGRKSVPESPEAILPPHPTVIPSRKAGASRLRVEESLSSWPPSPATSTAFREQTIWPSWVGPSLAHHVDRDRGVVHSAPSDDEAVEDFVAAE